MDKRGHVQRHMYGIYKKKYGKPIVMFDGYSGTPPKDIAYNGKPGELLDSLPYQHFCQKVATNTSHVQPQSLPPTSAAAKYHSLRVFFQIQKWKGSADEFIFAHRVGLEGECSRSDANTYRLTSSSRQAPTVN